MIRTSFKARFTACWRTGLVGAGLSILFGLNFSSSEINLPELSLSTPVARWLAALSYDIPFWLPGRTTTAEAVIVPMDEQTYQALGQNTSGEWSRTLHARLLSRLIEEGARLVVFDILFNRSGEPSPSADPVGDRKLAAAVDEAAGRVLLAAVLAQSLEGPVPGSPKAGASLISTPLLPSLPVARPVDYGVVAFPLEFDGRVRRHYTNANYTSLALKAAQMIQRAPADPQAPRWFNFYGPAYSLERKSYHEALYATNLPAGYFKDKVVFVGRERVIVPAGTRSDEHQTPCLGLPFPGVELQATAFLNLVRNDALRQLSPSAEAGLLVACGIVFGFGLVLWRPWIAVPMALGGALLTAGAALWFVSWRFVWFPWMVVVAVQVPFALLWSIAAHTRWLTLENADLERKLATSLLAAAPGRLQGPLDTSAAGRRPAIPDHTLLRRIGQGAYGEVWLARDLVGNFRAVKAVYRERFPRVEPYEREFRGIQKYSPISRSHPGWLDILHVGRNDAAGYFFYIMELGDDEMTGQRIDPERYVARSLAGDLSRHGKLAKQECVRISVALAEALAYLHRAGLIHRDIKPSNVIFVHGGPKFADIGLVTEAREPGRDVSLLGTEGYMAPEGPGSALADLFSLGKLIYELCTGHDRRVFPDMPTSLIEGTPDPDMEELYRIVLKACEFEPRYRYQSAEELQADLRKLETAG
jgi:CHASE2 domain-containing sensor protein